VKNFDDEFAPPQPPKDWNYDTPGVLRKMVSLYANGDEARAEQLIQEADADVAAMRAKVGGRKVTCAAFDGTERTRDMFSAEYKALMYVLKLQS
jgi:hypothetical protein